MTLFSDTKWKFYLLIGIASLLVLVTLSIILVKSMNSSIQPTAKVNLQFWGVFDDPGYFTQVINGYQKINPKTTVSYRKFNYDDYEKQLIDSFASGVGPDIWLMHNTWLPKHGDKILAMPTKQKSSEPWLSFKDFQDQFVEVAVTDLTLGGQIYSLPIYVDTLGLFYNRDLFNSTGIASPPQTWEEFNGAIKKLTQLDGERRIVKSGVALGTARNINRSTDILSLLMLQSGVQMTDQNNFSATFASSYGNTADVAVQYYTDFSNSAKQVFTWNDQQHYSIDSFSEGGVAMMINYSHQIATVKAKAPRLNFSVAPVPQISMTSTAVNYANYWAPTVSKQSKNAQEAWKFLIYLSSNQGATSYLNASNRPTARRDLIPLQQNDTFLGPFATQSLSARSWYQVDNLAIESLLAEMIDDINYGRASVRDALRATESKVNVLMRK
jgi:multiple sugar transport system substrate-binding protein